MREHLDLIQQWQQNSTRFAIATVMKTWGSSPRPTGSVMLIAEDSTIAGSVSGGCIEGQVTEIALEILKGTSGARLIEFGVTDDEAWTVGLSCGGKVEVLIELCPGLSQDQDERDAWGELIECLTTHSPCVYVTEVLDDMARHAVVDPDGGVTGSKINNNLIGMAQESYTERATRALEAEGNRVLLHVHPRKSRILIIGAAHITSHLVQLGYHFEMDSYIIDPRGFFTESTTFPVAPKEIIESYPSEVLGNFDLDPYTYAVILSHDPKIDDDALRVLLRSDVAYIGALGSKRTHAKRVARLQEGGFSDDEIARINAPIGMDINARGAAEIALSIISEIVRVKNINR